jgi:hypothetical protein
MWDIRENITPENYDMDKDEVFMCDDCFREMYGKPQDFVTVGCVNKN